jgi:formylglycine-generating enzyme required for sulfatase activity
MRRLQIVGLSLLICAFWLYAQDGQKNVTRDRPANQKWAVLIGVAQYTNVTKLKCCGKDALALKDRLVQAGFPADHVFVLHSAAKDQSDLPFKANIERQLESVLGYVNGKGEQVKGRAGEGDLVVVSFSGHGVSLPQTNASYLCPAETHLAKPETLIPLEQVYRQLQACPAERKLLLVDACRNEPVVSGARAAAGDDRVQEFARTLEAMPKGKGLLVLTSCSVGECSYEEEEWGHGIFTYYLLEGLGGAADERRRGYVTMLDLYQYASEKTTTYVKRVKKEEQKPKLRTGENEFGDFTIGVVAATPPLLDCTGEKGRTAEEVQEAQKAWAKSLGWPVEKEDEIAPGVKMKFVLVPPGKFLMGSPKSELEALLRQFPDATPEMYGDEVPHEVTITRPFYLGKTEVTQAQYKALGKENKSRFKGDDRPVENVSWEEADAFARELSQKKAGSKLLYRLPTEAEWEYACRAGTTGEYCSGNGEDALKKVGWYYGNSKEQTQPVGKLAPNAWGLYDMHGNVWEWCGDWADDYPSGKVTDPKGPEKGSRHIYRGGGWAHTSAHSRAAKRGSIWPGNWYTSRGFRLAQVPSEK